MHLRGRDLSVIRAIPTASDKIRIAYVFVYLWLQQLKRHEYEEKLFFAFGVSFIA